MQRFKEGDLVEVTEAYLYNWYSEGEVYEVRRQEGDNVFVNGVEGFQYGCFNGDNDNSIWISSEDLTLKTRITITDEISNSSREIIGYLLQQSLAQSALQEALEETEENNAKFRIGDSVVISEDSEHHNGSESNPKCPGVVSNDSILRPDDNYKYKVEWGNGCHNYYRYEDLEPYVEEPTKVQMIINEDQIREAAEFCETFNPYVHEDADFFEQKIYDCIERYEEGDTCKSIYGFYVKFEKEYEDAVCVNVLVNPALGCDIEYTEATLSEGILVHGW